MSYFIIGGTNIAVGQKSGGRNVGGRNVGGRNVCGTYVCRTKVAPPASCIHEFRGYGGSGLKVCPPLLESFVKGYPTPTPQNIGIFEENLCDKMTFLKKFFWTS
jgi:hypothetical protein